MLHWSFGMALVMPYSGIVFPRRFGFCSVAIIGISKTLAAASCEKKCVNKIVNNQMFVKYKNGVCKTEYWRINVWKDMKVNKVFWKRVCSRKNSTLNQFIIFLITTFLELTTILSNSKMTFRNDSWTSQTSSADFPNFKKVWLAFNAMSQRAESNTW